MDSSLCKTVYRNNASNVRGESFTDLTLSVYVNNDELIGWDSEHIDRLISIISSDLINYVFAHPVTSEINYCLLTPDFQFNTDAIKMFVEETEENYNVDLIISHLYTYNWDTIIFKNVNRMTFYIDQTSQSVYGDTQQPQSSNTQPQLLEWVIESSETSGIIKLGEFIGAIYRLKKFKYDYITEILEGTIITESSPGYLSCEVTFAYL